jgi:hypothetical protein
MVNAVGGAAVAFEPGVLGEPQALASMSTAKSNPKETFKDLTGCTPS